jgi:hypothetical protein
MLRRESVISVNLPRARLRIAYRIVSVISSEWKFASRLAMRSVPDDRRSAAAGR